MNVVVKCSAATMVIAALLTAMPAGAWGQTQTPTAPAPGARDLVAGAREKAVRVILEAAGSDDPRLRANAMEAIEPDAGRALPVVQMGLDDESPAVRFAALVTAGKLRMQSLRPAAQRRLNDPNASVRAAALFAVKASGGQVDLSPMAAMLASDNPGLRSNVAMLLGLLGDASAAPMLKEMAAVPMPKASDVRAALVRVQVAEAVALLGDDEALDALRASAYSPYDEVRILAVQAMGHVRDRRMAPAMIRMLEENPVELRLAAAEALGRMGLSEGKAEAIKAAASTIPTVRVQTAFALRRLNDPAAAAALVGLLSDADPTVRLAAAAAALQPMRP